jgi:uncharacterized protein (TIGR02594 family)
MTGPKTLLSRRAMVRIMGCAAAFTPMCVAYASGSVLPQGIGETPDFTGPLPPSRLGTQRPLTGEERIAAAILDEAPHGPDPISIASYFLGVAQGKFGDSWAPYASGWPTRWNPVIKTFFRATGTTPSGDTTPWCAAFLNWCYLRSTNAPATGSASSGSFRCYGLSTDSPRVGDIVVFRKRDSEEACLGSGHVGFFLAQTNATVEVLGGNQIDGHTGCHSISSTPLSKNGKELVLHSFRRV